MSFTFNRQLVGGIIERNGHITRNVAEGMLGEIDRLTATLQKLHNAMAAERAALFGELMARLIRTAQQNANGVLPVTYLLAAKADPEAFWKGSL
ncbi:MAG: hypothetical protein NVS1B16_03680 [Pseudarthrobacter sp.]